MGKSWVELERRIKRIAAFAAAGTLVASGIGWVIEPGSDIFMAGTVSSAVALALFLALLFSSTPAVLVVAVTAPLTILTAWLVPEQPIQTMAAVAIVVISIAGVLLVPEGWRSKYLVIGAVVIAAHTALSGQPAETILSVGATSAVCFLLGASLVSAAIRESTQAHAERLDLLDMAPAFISEDDWTEAERRVRELGITDTDALRTRLLADRDLVAEIVGTVRVIHHNPALVETFGEPSEAGRFSPGRVHEHSLPAFVEQLVSIVADKPFHDDEYRTTTRTGDPIVIALRSIVNRRHPGQTRVLLVAQDVTEKHEARVSLEQAIRAKNEFVAGVSHELRTPLAGVVGLTATVLDDQSLTAESRELLEMVADQGNEMARIIEDLLVASRSHDQELSVEVAPVDACAEVRSVAAGRDVTVKADGPIMVLADAGRLRQIVRNLMTNAARYGRPPVEVQVDGGAERVWIEVADAGEPIPEDQRERVFEPFRSAAVGERHAGSVGLGLAVSRMLARQMGGDLTYSHDGRSRFRLELPALQEQEAPA